MSRINLGDYNGYNIQMPTSGGKAGTGCNKSGSLQAYSRANGCLWFEKQVRIADVNCSESRIKAMRKIKAWIDAKKKGPQ